MAVTIVKGSDTSVVVTIKEKETGANFDLTGFTSASAYFAGEEDTVIVPATLHGPAECGQLDVSLDKDISALLQAGDGSNMEVRIDQGSIRTIVQFEGQIDIKEELF